MLVSATYVNINIHYSLGMGLEKCTLEVSLSVDLARSKTLMLAVFSQCTEEQNEVWLYIFKTKGVG